MKKLFLIPLVVYASVGMSEIVFDRYREFDLAVDMMRDELGVHNIVMSPKRATVEFFKDVIKEVEKIQGIIKEDIRDAFDYIVDEIRYTGMEVPQGSINNFSMALF